MPPMTLTQKILAAHALGLDRPHVQAGDVLRVRVDWTIASELAWNGMDKTYAELGRPKLHDANRFFLAVDGLDTDYGPTTPDMFEAQLNGRMMEIAKETVVVSDSSKLGRRSLSRIGPIEKVSRVITDKRAPEDCVRSIRAKGIEVVLA